MTGKVVLQVRRRLILLHLYIAALLAPMVFLVAISGGLYLVGVKGSVASTPVSVPAGVEIDPSSSTIDEDVRTLLSDIGIEHDFEYVKVSGDTLLTRPTSRTHYEIRVGEDSSVEMRRNVPDLQYRMIELHKGHGPGLFRHFQKVTAVGLLLIVISGLMMGLASSKLRTSAVLTACGGLILFLLLVLLA